MFWGIIECVNVPSLLASLPAVSQNEWGTSLPGVISAPVSCSRHVARYNGRWHDHQHACQNHITFVLSDLYTQRNPGRQGMH